MSLIKIEFKEGELTPPCIVYFKRNDGIVYSIKINSADGKFKLNTVKGFKGNPTELADYLIKKFKLFKNTFQITDPVSPLFLKELINLNCNIVKIDFTNNKKKKDFLNKLHKMQEKKNTPTEQFKKEVINCLINYYSNVFGMSFTTKGLIARYGKIHFDREYSAMRSLINIYMRQYSKYNIKDVCRAIGKFANLAIELNPFWENQLYVYQLLKHKKDLEENISIIKGKDFFDRLISNNRDNTEPTSIKQVINKMFNKVYNQKDEERE